MSVDWELVSWPLSRLGEGIEGLARHCGFPIRARAPSAAPPALDPVRLGEWIEATAHWLGVEAEPVESRYPDLSRFLRASAPSLICLPATSTSTEPRWLGMIRTSSGKAFLLGTDLAEYPVPLELLRKALCQDREASLASGIEPLLDRVGLSSRRRLEVRSAMLKERLSQWSIGDCWLLRSKPGDDFTTQARRARLPHYLAVFVSAHFIEYLLWILSWWLIGRGVLEGRLEWGWLLAWALILLTMLPFRLLATWHQGLIAVTAGSLLKKRLLQGALRLKPDEIRHQGAGHHLGRVIESEAVESLALSGGLLTLAGAIELAVATTVLALGAGGVLHLVAFCGWLGLASLLGWRYFVLRRRWTQSRLGITHEMIECMVGHRTRLAQQSAERVHEDEDPALSRYVELSRKMDRVAVWIRVLPRGWVALGLIGLAPAFISATPGGLAPLAVGLGGVLLVEGALYRLVLGFSSLTDAGIAWKQVAPLFRAAAREEMSPDPSLLPTTSECVADGASSSGNDGQPLLEANELLYRYPERGEPVLRGCSFQFRHGDRVLLESPSGGGKSTLVSLMNGLRSPDSGLLLLHGLDRRSWGARAWTRRVSCSPQFHENHVIAETFAFNLLMGRGWPPRTEDLEEAEALCRELGLGDLLDRMPAGLLQRVGETGWQLSHGEKTRLFMARALLQGADLVVLDESFAALDPDNLRKAVDCALRRAPTLVVIANP